MATDNWNAGLYDAKHSFVWEKAKDLVGLLNAKSGERILDLGCGTGELSAQIATSGAEVVGVDRSAKMIEEARRKFPNLRFEVCDARELPWEQEFDAVFSNAALHWIPQAGPVVAGIAHSLRPAGRFVAEFGGKGNVRRVVAVLEGALDHMGISAAGANLWFYPSVAEYSALLEMNGLEVREAALFERSTNLADGERGLENWIRMFAGSFLERVPEAQQEEYLLVAERIARPALWKENHWEFDYRRLRIVATKTRS